jgi:hypothetical protein
MAGGSAFGAVKKRPGGNTGLWSPSGMASFSPVARTEEESFLPAHLTGKKTRHLSREKTPLMPDVTDWVLAYT